MTKIKDDEAAIVFSKDKVELIIPNGDDDAIVSKHALLASCFYIMMNEHFDKIQPILENIREELANE